MIGSSSLSSLLWVNGNSICRVPHILSPSSPIIRTYPTSRIHANSLVARLAGPYSSRILTSSGKLLLEHRWDPLMPFLERSTWIPLLTMQTPPSSQILWSSMPSTSPSLVTSSPPQCLIPLFSRPLQPWMRDLPCSLVPLLQAGHLTMAISISANDCMFLPPPALPSSIRSMPPPFRATWESSTPSLSTFVKHFIAGCAVCQQNKVNTHPTVPPLCPITSTISLPFKQLSVDLITDLSVSSGFDSVMVVVDHGLTKGVILAPCSKTVDAAGISQLFFDFVFK